MGAGDSAPLDQGARLGDLGLEGHEALPGLFCPFVLGPLKE